jgi:voltage-gated potassium channel
MKATQVITNVFKNRFQELMIAFLLTTALIIISACLMFFAEHNAQPEKFTSIPATLYWSVVTLTTTGYGDLYPITRLGRLLTGVVLMAGIALFALPAGIITAGFLEEIRKVKRPNQIICPNCGETIDMEEHTMH